MGVKLNLPFILNDFDEDWTDVTGPKRSCFQARLLA
jgi:hypothetical protein